MSVALVDIGCGNIASVAFAFERLGATVDITRDPGRIAKAVRVVLPGVSAAGHAMMKIDKLDLRDTLRALRQPTLGICLGMQLLCDASEEDGGVECLGVIKGTVRKLPASPETPTPHMGWSRLAVLRKDAPLVQDLSDDAYVYFAHSYACGVDETTDASAKYGGAFAAIAQRGNFYGCQFHPERSGDAGATVLKNFLKTPC